jgi:uncharacterized RDD family membrane protein YckC
MDPQQSPAGAPPPPAGAYTVQSPQTWSAPAEEIGPAPGIRFAGHGSRLVAYIIDGLIQFAVAMVLFLVVSALFLGAAATDSDAAAGAAIGGFLLVGLFVVLFTLVYFPWFWVRGGQTPGMKIMHIRVVRDADGGPIGWGAAILRLVGYWVNQLVFYIGFIWIFVDKRRRGWHDLIASTVVIEQP